ncbi:hypothetical protein BT96DRAFT_936373 [Gymnopus androsaceus JB14]|uniref:Uncharacterized protein n=1 Tax=Gymnopus androsaceus JB14 TaxID=1447944 RepID=A0A6A4HL84_9AGAR|nr:hypothetical protein BT96DRAFT_939942 [Gymnopus androsaceus JB14]KAE9403530.1 hypothetical protein BT96DRAFT_936373 [Gymnopus androsaceus JB14]
MEETKRMMTLLKRYAHAAPGIRLSDTIFSQIDITLTAHLCCSPNSHLPSPTTIQQPMPLPKSATFTDEHLLEYFHEHGGNSSGESNEARIKALAHSKSLQVTPEEHQHIAVQRVITAVKLVEAAKVVETKEDDAWEWDAKEKKIRVLEKCSLTGKLVWTGKYMESQ